MANRDFLFRAKADTKNYDSNLAKARQQLDGFAKANLSAGGAIKQLSGSLVSVAARFASVTAAVGALGTAFRSNIQTALGFEKSMSQLSSLTGMVGKDLERLKGYAIELGSTTTLSASQVADAFKMIGSQQPQLLASGEALKAVTKNAITLAEAAGIDLATAAQTLSTSINQMGGDSANAERYINVLAAASQKGAGDIAWLGEAITKSATAAKAVGTEYEELVSILEQLAKAGFDASTAGTALRSIIMNLEKQSNSQFKPSVVGLTQAFENLGKAQLDITGYQEIAGKMFATQAKVLAEAAGEARNMKDAITGTNTAEEQAKTNTDNLDGSLKSLASAWEGLNLHINSSNGLLKTFVDWAKDAIKWGDRAFTSSGRQSGFRDDLQNSKSTKMFGQNITGVVPNLQRLGGSNYKGQVYHEIQQMYNNAILAGISYRDNKTQPGSKSREDAQAYLDEIKAAQEEFTERAKKMLGITKPQAGEEGKQKLGIKEEAETATKSIKQLQDELKKLKQARDEAADAGNHDLVEEYNADIKRVQDEIKAMRGTTKIPKSSKSDDTPIIINDPRKGLGFSAGGTPSMNELKKTLAYYQSLLNSATTQGEYQFAESGISSTEAKIAAQPKALELGVTIPEAEVITQVESLRENLESYFKENPLTISVGQNLTKEGKNADKAWQQAAGAVQSVGNALNQIEDPGVKAMGTVMQAIASIALGFAQASAQAGSMGPWAWLAFIAAGMAATATTIATVHSLTGFAEGGIVPGNSFSGDNLHTADYGINSGELILNKAQQSTLASQLQDSEAMGAESRPYVTGEKIVLGINNWGRRYGKGELVFSKS